MKSKHDYIKVNNKIDVQLEGRGVFYKSMIQEVTDDYLAVSVPSHRGREITLIPGDVLKCRVYSEDAQYNFSTTVLGKKLESLRLILLATPTRVERTQNRDFVRVKLQIPVRYEKADSGANPDDIVQPVYSGFTVDISGGGMQLLVSHPYAVDTLLAILFEIEDEKKANMVIRTLGKVCRKERSPKSENRYILGIRFEEITEQKRDQVIAFLFRKMLEQKFLGVDK